MANDERPSETTVSYTPSYTRQDVDNCAFTAWYPKLQHVSIKSVIIPLPDAFTTLLLKDGVKLPSIHSEPVENEVEDAIQHVQSQITAAIKRFHGRVFPKLNWSAPQDALWMLGTLQCTSFDDVFLLLKASDFIVHDLIQPYAGCMDVNDSNLINTSPTLVLKKWCHLYDSMIFRCFITQHTKLIAVSQRHITEFYPFLIQQQDELCQIIYSFLHNLLLSTSIVAQADYIVDVYVDKQHRVYLLDVNVFGAITNPLLFTWEELLTLRQTNEEEEEVTVDFRVVESSCGIRPHPLNSYRVPTDFVDHLADGMGFNAFMEQVQRDNATYETDEEQDGETEEEEEEDDEDEDIKWGSDDERYE